MLFLLSTGAREHMESLSEGDEACRADEGLELENPLLESTPPRCISPLLDKFIAPFCTSASTYYIITERRNFWKAGLLLDFSIQSRHPL